MKARFFNCFVKLGGDPVIALTPKYKVSEFEVKVLRAMHGDDAVQRLTEIEPADIDKASHLYALAAAYGGSDIGTKDRPVGKMLIEKLFGVTLDNYESWIEESLEREAREREERQKERAARETNRGKAIISETPQITTDGQQGMEVAAAGSDVATPRPQRKALE